MPRALIIGRDDLEREQLAALVKPRGFDVTSVARAAEARELLVAGTSRFDLVLLDVVLEDQPGLALLEDIDTDEIDVVVTADRPTLGSAVEALRAGASDYLEKPCREEHLDRVLRAASRAAKLRSERDTLSGQLRRLGRFGSMVGASAGMQRVFDHVRRMAPSGEPAFILGETGTGKELVARSLHERSPRTSRPFVPVNCAAVSPSLFESELFGHVKGAFTGAEASREGLFEQADGGSLFLDEVTEMPLELQAKLLRVLETGSLTRVGDTKVRQVDVRIIAASNRKPESALAEGKIRKDLLYRLLVLPIEIPPLRERGRDVRLLAQAFVNEVEESSGRSLSLGARALQKIEGYSWPGNVRELRNAIQRAALLAEDEIHAEHLALGEGAMAGVAERVVGAEAASAGASSEPATETPSADDPGTLRLAVGDTSIAEAEKKLILATLERCEGNKRAAARVLGISVKTLYTRLHRYGTPMRRHKSRD